MTKDRIIRSSLSPEERRRIRCLKIIDSTYYSGGATVGELAEAMRESTAVTDADADIVQEDIALLQRGGLVMAFDSVGRWRIEAVVPGFALRLTAAEASMAWARGVAYASSTGPSARSASTEPLKEAVAILLSGLRHFHPNCLALTSDDCMLTQASAPDVCNVRSWPRLSDLTGEARLACRRLRIVDLLEKRRARNTGQLAAMLGMSIRSVHDDLNVLRRCGFDIKFRRFCHSFRLNGLNTYLAENLTPEAATSLLALFESPEDQDDKAQADSRSGSALLKLIDSLRLLLSCSSATCDASGG